MFNQTLLDYLLHQSNVIYFVLDSEYKMTQTNGFTDSLLDKPMVGRSVFELIETFGKPVDFHQLAVQSEQSHCFSVSQASGQPQSFYFRFFSGENGTTLALGTFDYQEYQELQHHLLSMNQELNHLSRNLQKKTVALNRAKEEQNNFLGMASHDLRNPLGVIMSCAQLILKEPEDLNAKQSDLLGMIKKSSQFMLSLLNDLLDFTKIESGNLNLACVTTDYMALLQESIVFNQMLASERELVIRLVERPAQLELNIDARKIQQVFNNLLSNALKYSESGGTVDVRVYEEPGYIVVSVADQGPGIALSEQKNIFNAFSMSRSESLSREKSTGLGLSIAKKIVCGHGGDLWVESEVGKGSVFSFSLPISAADTDAVLTV